MKTHLLQIFFIFTLVGIFVPQTLLASGSTGGGGGSAGGGGAAQSGGSGNVEVPQINRVAEKARDLLRTRLKEKKLFAAQANEDTSNSNEKYDHNFEVWNSILEKVVSQNDLRTSSVVSYDLIDRSALAQFLKESERIKEPTVKKWTAPQQLAFYLNVYNARTLEIVLTKYPDIKSIKDLNSGFPTFQSVWQKKFFPLFGKPTSLDDIEHGYVRGSKELKDPLVHFAFVCASVGCPQLAKKPFIAETLESQLTEQFKLFLQDRIRNRLNRTEKILEISKIFDWYKGDFEEGLRGYESLKQTLIQNADYLADTDEDKAVIKAGDFKIKFLDYDWKLNKK